MSACLSNTLPTKVYISLQVSLDIDYFLGDFQVEAPGASLKSNPGISSPEVTVLAPEHATLHVQCVGILSYTLPENGSAHTPMY